MLRKTSYALGFLLLMFTFALVGTNIIGLKGLTGLTGGVIGESQPYTEATDNIMRNLLREIGTDYDGVIIYHVDETHRDFIAVSFMCVRESTKSGGMTSQERTNYEVLSQEKPDYSDDCTIEPIADSIPFVTNFQDAYQSYARQHPAWLSIKDDGNPELSSYNKIYVGIALKKLEDAEDDYQARVNKYLALVPINTQQFTQSPLRRLDAPEIKSIITYALLERKDLANQNNPVPDNHRQDSPIFSLSESLYPQYYTPLINPTTEQFIPVTLGEISFNLALLDDGPNSYLSFLQIIQGSDAQEFHLVTQIPEGTEVRSLKPWVDAKFKIIDNKIIVMLDDYTFSIDNTNNLMNDGVIAIAKNTIFVKQKDNLPVNVEARDKVVEGDIQPPEGIERIRLSGGPLEPSNGIA